MYIYICARRTGGIHRGDRNKKLEKSMQHLIPAPAPLPAYLPLTPLSSLSLVPNGVSHDYLTKVRH